MANMAQQTDSRVDTLADPVAHRKRRRFPVLFSLFRNLPALASVIFLIALVVVAIFAPVIAPYHPAATNLANNFAPPVGFGGSSDYVMGTDDLGRDILSRVIYGSRVSVVVGIVTVAVAGALGVVLGLISGYYRGLVDDGIMWVTNVVLSFPFILLAIAIMAVLGGGIINVIIVLALTRWVDFARVVRGQTFSVSSREYVEAARAVGASDARLITYHILPNLMTPVIIVATFAVAFMIVAEASLSFLGVGIQPPTATWGGMLADARTYIRTSWWMSTFPGLAIMLTVLAINFVGDWIRDVLDPRFSQRV